MDELRDKGERMLKGFRWVWLVLVPPLLVLGGFVTWASTPASPLPEALAALESDALVEVEQEPWLAFHPIGGEPDVGLILYPGGRVDPRAYAPAARAIAAEGYLVVVVPMPLNLAVFGPDAAAGVMAAFAEIDRWVVGGHSLGGAMAAHFVYDHEPSSQGLVLWAAYPDAGDDLSGRSLPVVSIYGTRDGVASPEEITASHPLLPPDTRWVAIPCGNHAQFGWYGPQPGDSPACTSRVSQQREIVVATLDLLAAVGGDEP